MSARRQLTVTKPPGRDRDEELRAAQQRAFDHMRAAKSSAKRSDFRAAIQELIDACEMYLVQAS